MSNKTRFGTAALAAYVAAILLANWLVVNVAPVVVWPVPELHAPAGVFAAGLCFTFRNLTQQTLGRRFGFLAIVLGAGLSYAIAPGATLEGGLLPLSIASGLTFLLSETADALLWTRLRARGYWVGAMVAGDLVGQVVDSAVFLFLAFGAPGVVGFLAGQIVGKFWCTYVTVAAMVLARRIHRRHLRTFRLVTRARVA